MRLVVQFDIDADIIEVPEEIISKIDFYREEFLKWLFDKNNNHNYWKYKNGEKFACSYRSEAFCEFLNKYHLGKNKAEIIQTRITQYDKEMPVILF